jgi:glycosyltransferase involved in cell wall biosynthesis
LPKEVAELATIKWRPGLIGDVDVFIQLAVAVDSFDHTQLDLLRAPWIRRISTFLDDIQGSHGPHFIGRHAQFWDHQVSLEKIRSSDVVLVLGESSLAEARRLWASADAAERLPKFVITSCKSGLPLHEIEPQVIPGNNFVVFGNHFPHKNVALVAAASGLIHDQVRGNPSLTFVGALNSLQEDQILRLAHECLGVESSRFISIARSLSGIELSKTISASRGVIVPSLHEGFSLPVLEAIERNIPIALSRIPAHLELLPEGPWFFDPRSVSDLVRATREMGDDGIEWVSEQRRALEHRYQASRLSDAVSSALLSLTREKPKIEAPLRNTPSAPADVLTENPRPADITAAELREQDRRIITMLLGRPRTSVSDDSSQVALPSFRREHDALVAEFHRSRTWRAGLVITAPARWIRQRWAKIT